MDTDVPGSSGPELREYTALLARRWRLVGAGVLGGLVLATAGVLVLPSAYTSVTAVQVQPTGLGQFTGEQSGRLAGDVNLDTEAQVVVSDQVSALVAQTLAGSGAAASTDELRDRVDVTVPPNSNVLEIHYTARSPQAARAGAEAYADAYLDLRRTQVEELVSSRLEVLRAEQENRYESLAEVAGSDSPRSNARADALRQEITDLGNGITPLSALRETVRAGTVITPAGLPDSASSPVPLLWLVGGAALGLLAGLLAAVVRDRLDPLLRDAEETARAGRLPVLLDLSGPRGDAPRGARFPGLLTDRDGDGQRVHELAHLIRARLAAPAALDDAGADRAEAPVPGAAPGTGAARIAELAELAELADLSGLSRAERDADERGAGRVLLVTASTPGRAGAAAAVNLAASLARTGSETLLVCADPRPDTVGELLGLSEGPGLAEALLEGEDPGSLEVRPDAAPRLRVLRYGSPGLTAPVQGTAMTELVRLLRVGAEYVVVAVGPVSERADAHALAASADLLLPVVELDRTRRTDLDALLVLADRFEATVPGTVVLPRQPSAGPAPATPLVSGAAGQGAAATADPDPAEAPARAADDAEASDTADARDAAARAPGTTVSAAEEPGAPDAPPEPVAEDAPEKENAQDAAKAQTPGTVAKQKRAARPKRTAKTERPARAVRAKRPTKAEKAAAEKAQKAEAARTAEPARAEDTPVAAAAPDAPGATPADADSPTTARAGTDVHADTATGSAASAATDSAGAATAATEGADASDTAEAQAPEPADAASGARR